MEKTIAIKIAQAQLSYELLMLYVAKHGLVLSKEKLKAHTDHLVSRMNGMRKIGADPKTYPVLVERFLRDLHEANIAYATDRSKTVRIHEGVHDYTYVMGHLLLVELLSQRDSGLIRLAELMPLIDTKKIPAEVEQDMEAYHAHMQEELLEETV